MSRIGLYKWKDDADRGCTCMGYNSLCSMHGAGVDNDKWWEVNKELLELKDYTPKQCEQIVEAFMELGKG